MRVLLSVMCGFLLAVASALTAQQPASQTAALPAPPAGAPGTYKTGVELMDWLKTHMSPTGEMTVSPVSITDQYRVNIVHRTKPAGAIAHPGNTELHYIIEGSGTVVTGGKLVPASRGSNAQPGIDGGVTRHVTKGDVIIIPENSAHWYSDIEKEITYLEVRWLAPAK